MLVKMVIQLLVLRFLDFMFVFLRVVNVQQILYWGICIDGLLYYYVLLSQKFFCGINYLWFGCGEVC